MSVQASLYRTWSENQNVDFLMQKLKCLDFKINFCCLAVTCSAINVDGASKSPDKPSYNYNEAVTYSCNDGYDHTSGDLVNTCTAIDTWSGAEPVCTGNALKIPEFEGIHDLKGA